MGITNSKAKTRPYCPLSWFNRNQIESTFRIIGGVGNGSNLLYGIAVNEHVTFYQILTSCLTLRRIILRRLSM